MLFNSYIFILFFLPVTLIGYFGLMKLHLRRLAQAELFLMSLFFYGYFNHSYVLIICTSIVFNYLLSRLILMKKSSCHAQDAFTGRQTANVQATSSVCPQDELTIRQTGTGQGFNCAALLTAGGIAANLAVLFYFKYYDFFIDNVNQIFGKSFELQHIILPLGISFFTFQQISYIIDSFRGETGDYTFPEYCVFVAFFPQLIAGPIVLHEEIIPQFRDEEGHRLNADNFAKGLWLFSAGLFKKVLVADTFSRIANAGYSDIAALSFTEALLVITGYSIQLYFDFSGYCDMASGIALMFNIKLPMNFDSPYQAGSIPEFWKRWHMTLTRFMVRYVYIPLGGSRKGALRTDFNIFLVFFLSGVWHGANWTYILWGTLQGLGNVVCRRLAKPWEVLPFALRWAVTIAFFDLTLIIFRAESLAQAGRFFGRLLHPSGFGVRPEFFSLTVPQEIIKLEEYLGIDLILRVVPYFNLLASYVLAGGCLLFLVNNQRREFKCSRGFAVLTAVMLVWSVVSLSGISEFLYFNF